MLLVFLYCIAGKQENMIITETESNYKIFASFESNYIKSFAKLAPTLLLISSLLCALIASVVKECVFFTTYTHA